jgi:hypothetical protein
VLIEKKPMKNYTLIALSCVLALASCQNQPEVKLPEVVLSSNDSLFKVNEGPYNFSICLPKDMLINHDAELLINEATGDLNITIGDNFHLVVTNRLQDLTSSRADMNGDGLFTNKVIEQDQSSILYEQLLPTGETFSYQFCKNINGNGQAYSVQSSPVGEFTLEAVNRMKQVAATIVL